MSALRILLPAALLTCLACLGCTHLPRPVHHPFAAVAQHPLDPLRTSEIELAFELVLARFRGDPSLPKDPLRFPLVALAEPDKAEVLAFREGQPFTRRAELEVLHYPSNRTYRVLLDLSRRQVLAVDVLPAGTQPALTSDEYEAASTVVRAYEPWQRAVKARGLDPARVYIDHWAAGETVLPPAVLATLPHGEHTRLMRCLTFDREQKGGTIDPAQPPNPYDRPVEGLLVTIDLNRRQVVELTDTVLRPVLADSGNASERRPLKPLHVVQPEGSDILLSGHRVRWHGWQFYVALHPREGLVLYDVRIEDGGVLRPIAYRLALSEIYVPYGLGEDKPTSYALEPGAFAVPYTAPDFEGLTRGRFAQHQLWLTRYRENERYAAGPFPNRGKKEDGVSLYSQDQESLLGQDLVVWYTIGFTHLARPEDHPVMPSESLSFRLVPRGFFARNPALDVADQR